MQDPSRYLFLSSLFEISHQFISICLATCLYQALKKHSNLFLYKHVCLITLANMM